jgi:hypothetical protein
MTGHKMFQLLHLKADLETKQVLKQLTLALRALAELKEVTETIPNQSILINTLPSYKRLNIVQKLKTLLLRRMNFIKVMQQGMNLPVL